MAGRGRRGGGTDADRPATLDLAVAAELGAHRRDIDDDLLIDRVDRVGAAVGVELEPAERAVVELLGRHPDPVALTVEHGQHGRRAELGRVAERQDRITAGLGAERHLGTGLQLQHRGTVAGQRHQRVLAAGRPRLGPRRGTAVNGRSGLGRSSGGGDVGRPVAADLEHHPQHRGREQGEGDHDGEIGALQGTGHPFPTRRGRRRREAARPPWTQVHAAYPYDHGDGGARDRRDGPRLHACGHRG